MIAPLRNYVPRDERKTVRMWAIVQEHAARAVVRDVSQSGFLLELNRTLAHDEAFTVQIGSARAMAARVVVALDGGYGCRFDTALTPDEFAELVGHGPFVSGAPTLAPEEPDAVDKLPRRTRLALLLGLTTLSWGVVGAGVALFR